MGYGLRVIGEEEQMADSCLNQSPITNNIQPLSRLVDAGHDESGRNGRRVRDCLFRSGGLVLGSRVGNREMERSLDPQAWIAIIQILKNTMHRLLRMQDSEF